MEKPSFRKYSILFFVLTGFILIACLILLGSVPPVSRDALTHHLIIPKLYLKHGGIFEIPYIEFSYYPMNLELLYMIPLYFGNDIIPKYIHFSFAIFTAILIYFYFKDKINGDWGIFGAFFFLTIPVIIKLSTIVYVDLGLIFFSTASILQIIKWRDNNFLLRNLIYAAILCGLALGTKYNGLIVFFILSVLVVWIYSRSNSSVARSQLNALKYGVVFMVLSLLVFSPWLIKNFTWTGNPIYPLFNGLLNFKGNPHALGAGLVSATELPEGWGHFAVRKIIYGEKWWEILLIPIRIFFQGTDNNPKYFDGMLTPFLFILPFFAFSKKQETDQKNISDRNIFLIFSVLLIIIVFLKQDMRIRWIGPAIPCLVILSVYGLKNISGFFPAGKLWNIGCVLICIGIIAVNIPYLAGQFNSIKPLDYLSGRVGRMDYIKRYWPEISTIDQANEILKKDHVILALFLGNRRYYSDHKMIFDNEMFKKTIKHSKEIEDIIDDLSQNGITHIIVNYDLFNQWAEKQFPDSERSLIKTFFNKIKILYAKDGFGLYEVNLSE